MRALSHLGLGFTIPKMQFSLLCAALIACGAVFAEARVRGRLYDEEKDTIVELPKLGAIQGKIVETAWSKREVLQFVDVRYAEPPTGQHRFKVGSQKVHTLKTHKKSNLK